MTREEFEDVSNTLALAISHLAVASMNRDTMERFCTFCAKQLHGNHFATKASHDLLFGMLKHVSDKLELLDASSRRQN